MRGGLAVRWVHGVRIRIVAVSRSITAVHLESLCGTRRRGKGPITVDLGKGLLLMRGRMVHAISGRVWVVVVVVKGRLVREIGERVGDLLGRRREQGRRRGRRVVGV